MTTWRVDGAGQTLALASDGGMPFVCYWGPSLPEGEDLAALAASTARDLTGGMLDVLAPVSLCPEPAAGFQGQPGLVVAEVDGTPLSPRFAFHAATQAGAVLRLESRSAGLRLVHCLEALPTGVLALWTELEADRLLQLHWLAARCCPRPSMGTSWISAASGSASLR